MEPILKIRAISYFDKPREMERILKEETVYTIYMARIVLLAKVQLTDAWQIIQVSEVKLICSHRWRSQTFIFFGGWGGEANAEGVGLSRGIRRMQPQFHTMCTNTNTMYVRPIKHSRVYATAYPIAAAFTK
jgi:hypothetical protein